jgi:hypothetical protein
MSVCVCVDRGLWCSVFNTDDLLLRITTITGIHNKILTKGNFFINFNKLILTILSTSVTHTRQHACNTCEAFPLKCWSLSDMMAIIGRKM